MKHLFLLAALPGVDNNLNAGRQLNLSAITLQGNVVKLAVPGMGATYDGKLEADGNSITGTLTHGTNPLPLLLKHATATTARELPPPPVAPKPSPAGRPGNAGFNVTATELRTRNISVAGIITFAFELHRTQVSGLPAWVENEGYSIVARLLQGGQHQDGDK